MLEAIDQREHGWCMARHPFLQLPAVSRAMLLSVLFVALVVFIAAPGIELLDGPPGVDVDSPEIRRTGHAAALLWLLTWWRLAASPRRIESLPASVAPAALVFYTAGCIVCVFHLVLAFHIGHAWSHQKAFDHTKQVGGVGEGVYVNYLFALVWTVDVIWVWISFEHYLNRPRWVRWLVHGFMGFIVFNAAVVFGSESARIQFLVFFPLAAAGAVVQWRRARVARTTG